MPTDDPFPEHLKEQASAEKMLGRLFPGANRLDPPFINATEFHTQHDLVDALTTFPSETLDQAVYDLLKRTSETHPDNTDSAYEQCELVHACALRLTKPGERDVFEKSYRGVMSSFPRPPESDTMTAFSKRFRAYPNNEIDKLAPK
jgi:hypothetical protein